MFVRIVFELILSVLAVYGFFDLLMSLLRLPWHRANSPSDGKEHLFGTKRISGDPRHT